MQKANKLWLHSKRRNKAIGQKVQNGKDRKISFENGIK